MFKEAEYHHLHFMQNKAFKREEKIVKDQF